jgi:hypothetical protein
VSFATTYEASDDANTLAPPVEDIPLQLFFAMVGGEYGFLFSSDIYFVLEINNGGELMAAAIIGQVQEESGKIF